MEQEIRDLKLRGTNSTISSSTEEILRLQQQILDRDIRIVEIQFDYSSQAGEINRLRRRIQEFESSIANNTTSTSSPPQNLRLHSVDVKAKSQGRRPAVDEEYEATIDAMKKVIEKLKNENERLRKFPPNETMTPQPKKASVDGSSTIDKKRYEKMKEELQEMKSKMKKYDDLVLKVKLHQQSVSTLRKQLQQKDEELLQQQSKIQEIMNEKEVLERRLLEMKDYLGKKGSSDQEISSLMEQLHDQEREIDRLRKAGSTPSTRNRDDTAALAKLEEENRKLKSELQAFDMDFFDEIENLKYEHAEAIRKLRIYSRKYGEIA